MPGLSTALVATPWTVRLTALPPLAIYVHIPWCVKKCPYCDFNSHAVPDNGRGGGVSLPEDEYVDALIADLESLLPSVWGRRVSTIFIGGGTPSLFSAAAIDRLLAAIRARVTLEPDAEITLEANPGTAESGRFAGYRAAGVNRLSLGIQSFDDHMLAALGRIHSANDARRAIGMALDVFDSVNLDLMYGLPGQTMEMAHLDLAEAIGTGVTHLSAYQLTLEPNTVFWSKRPQLPEHDLCADMQVAAEALLADAGFAHYETSAFAKPGQHCRHNLNYWMFGDYLGLGAGAHGKVSFPDRITRHERAKQPREYLSLSGRTAENIVSPRELPFEFMLNALRLVDGFDETLFPQRTGLSAGAIASGMRTGLERGLLESEGGRIRPTRRGQRFLNEALEVFLG